MDTQYTNSPSYVAVDEGRPWRPGFAARLPWLGLGALLGSIIGVAASIGILVASNGEPISTWTFQPTVYLSIASTLTNIMLHFALSEGVNIAWWRRAVKDQTQLGDLHRYWDFGNNLWAATTSGRHCNLIALACIFTAIAPINGPLLQRASTVTIGTVVSPATLKVSVAPTVNQSTGYLSGRQYAASLITKDFSPVVQNYYNGADISMTDTGCSGICSARVRGAGFAVNCSSYTVPFNVNPQSQSNGTYDAANDPSLINGTYVFMSGFTWYAHAPGNISLNVQYKDTADCAGNLNVQNCSLRSATVQYPVIIDSNKSTIALDPQSTIFDDVVEDIINVEADNRQGPTILGGFWLALNNKFDSTAHLRFVGAVGYELLTTGSTATQYAILDDVLKTQSPFNMGMCALRFNNPTSDLVQEARKFMFRTVVAEANSSDVQYVSASQTATHTVYQSHYLFLGIAIVITIIAVLLVTITFHGYWHLGRNVTMSPIETAKAFNAPLLRNEDSNAEVESLIKKIGDRNVRYGVVINGLEGEGTAVGKEYSQVTATNLDGSRQMHLEVADECVVQVPKKGWKFSG